MTTFKTTLLVLTFAAFQFFVANACALPTVIDYAHFTDRRGPHSLPGAVVGDKVQIVAFLESSDPIGSPNVSVQAIQGGTTLALDPVPPIHPLFPGQYVYAKFIDFDPGLTGSWEFIPTDSKGTGTSTFGNALVDPEFLPLVDDVTVQGTPAGARVSWTLPNLAGFDVDGVLLKTRAADSCGKVIYFLFKQPVLHPRRASCRSASIMCTGSIYSTSKVLVSSKIHPRPFHNRFASRT